MDLLAKLVISTRPPGESAYALNQLGILAGTGNRAAATAIQEKCALFSNDNTSSSLNFDQSSLASVGQSLWQQIKTRPAFLQDVILYLANNGMISNDVASDVVANSTQLDIQYRWKVLGAIAQLPAKHATYIPLEAIKQLSFGTFDSSIARTQELLRIQSNPQTAPESAEKAREAALSYLHETRCADLVKKYPNSTDLMDGLAEGVKQGKSPAPLFNIASLGDPNQLGQSNYALDKLIDLLSQPDYKCDNGTPFSGIEEVVRIPMLSSTDRARLVATFANGAFNSNEAARTALRLIQDNSTHRNDSDAVPFEVKSAAISALGVLLTHGDLLGSMRSEIISQLRAFRQTSHPLTDVSAEALSRRGAFSNIWSAVVDSAKRWKEILT